MVLDVFNYWSVGSLQITLDGWDMEELLEDLGFDDGFDAAADVVDGLWWWNASWEWDDWFFDGWVDLAW